MFTGNSTLDDYAPAVPQSLQGYHKSLVADCEPHVPHPFAVLMLRGLQLRFYRDREAFNRGRELAAEHPHECYEFSFLQGNKYVRIESP